MRLACFRRVRIANRFCLQFMDIISLFKCCGIRYFLPAVLFTFSLTSMCIALHYIATLPTNTDCMALLSMPLFIIRYRLVHLEDGAEMTWKREGEEVDKEAVLASLADEDVNLQEVYKQHVPVCVFFFRRKRLGLGGWAGGCLNFVCVLVAS